VADDALAARLGCRPGRRWLHISMLRRLAENTEAPPICWTDVYVDGRFSLAVRPRLAGHVGAISNLLEEISGRRVGEIRQTIRAIGVPEAMAAALRTPANDHALEIRRQYITRTNDVIEVSISIHPSDRFAFTTHLLRARPNGTAASRR
jgi:DNA-binding GntR family transcriptional regulator